MSYIGQSDIFDANQIIDRTLFAVKNIPIKRYPSASYPVVYTAKPGESIGRVYSWVMDGHTLYWQFYDAQKKPYYAKHESDAFSIDALQQQGAMTIKEIKQASEEQNKPWWEQLFGGVGSGAKGIVTIGALVVGAFLLERLTRK